MSCSKIRYSKFCREVYTPVHLQPWWLDAVCGPQAWGAAVAADRQGLPVAILPYFKTCFWGLPVIRQAPYTAYAGPWFQPEFHQTGALSSRRLGLQHRVMAELIEQLPRIAYFKQTFRPEITNWLPFFWAGFRQTTRYTYVLPNTTDLSALYAGLKSTLRTDLRRAEQGTEITDTNDSQLLFELNRKSFSRKGLSQPYTYPAFQHLHQALTARRQAFGLLARDRRTGQPQAGLLLAFDARQASVLLTGLDPAHCHSGALHGLYWHAIRFCSKRGLSLDFEGSMQVGIARVFRNFGGGIRPCFQVWRFC